MASPSGSEFGANSIRYVATAPNSLPSRLAVLSPIGLACTCALSADPTAVRGYADRAARVAEEAPSVNNISCAANMAGFASLADGNAETALELFAESRAVAAGIPRLHGDAAAYMTVAAATSETSGDDVFLDALDVLYRGRMSSLVWVALEALAVHWSRRERSVDAATLIGRLERQGVAYGPLAGGRSEAEDLLRQVDRTAEARTRGAAMSRDEIAEFALQQLGVEPVQ